MSESTEHPPVEVQLAVINTKLDVLIEQRTDHETRLRTLERFRWLLLGTAVSAGPLVNALVSTLGK